MNLHGFNTTNYWENRIDPKTGKRYLVDAVVLHITDGTSESAKAWFSDPNSNASSNYLVDEKGLWWEIVPERHSAWANGKVVNPSWSRIRDGINPNLYTISIEVANTGLFPSITQWFSWARGVREICHKNGIPMDKAHIVDHREINALKRCPGSWYNRSWLLTLQKII